MTANKKRILFISPQPFFQWRGSPIRVGFNLLALSELGYEVDLLTLPFGEERELPGVRVIRAPNIFGVKNIPIGPSLIKALFDLVLLIKGWSLIRRNRYDVVHGVEDAGFFGVFLAWRAGAKLIFEKHSDPGSYRKNFLRNIVMWLYTRAESFSIRHADAVIGTGPGLVEQARRVAPDKPAHHISDIPSSLEEPTEAETRRVRDQLVQTPDEVLIAYVGSFAVYQGIELIFSSIPLVHRRCPQARFIIIGGTNEEIAARRAQLAAEGAERAVTFLGKIEPDRLPNYLAASDVLLSSRIAGTNTPLKLLDYLKVGRAILATDNEANRQILDDAAALFVQPTPESFADGICRLVDDAALRGRLSAKGRALIDATYNFAEFKRRLSAVYTGIGPAGPL